MPNEFATFTVVPLSWPRRIPTTRLVEPRDRERAWWSATERRTKGCTTVWKKQVSEMIECGGHVRCAPTVVFESAESCIGSASIWRLCRHTHLFRCRCDHGCAARRDAEDRTGKWLSGPDARTLRTRPVLFARVVGRPPPASALLVSAFPLVSGALSPSLSPFTTSSARSKATISSYIFVCVRNAYQSSSSSPDGTTVRLGGR